MTKKSQLETLSNKINQTKEFFVISEEVGYLVVGTVTSLKIRVEKSGNIFQPFGKNVNKQVPVYFPVVVDMKEAKFSELVNGFEEHELPMLHINKRQLAMSKEKVEELLIQYLAENFS